jgi:hypothetical protein
MPPAGRDLDDVIETITIDCYGDDEEMGAFLQAFEDELELPFGAAVVGVAVEVVAVEHGGDVRRGLVARCRRDGRDYEVSLADIVLRASPHRRRCTPRSVAGSDASPARGG